VRRVPAAAACLALAGCGAATAPPKHAAPRLPRALAQAWAQQADAVASALAAGDGCTARARAGALQRRVIAAVNARRVPRRLLEPLSSGVNDLAGRITCSPPPPPAATSAPPPGHGKGRGKGHEEHGHGDGHGRGRGHGHDHEQDGG
jgi:hypothetical protein